MAKILARAMRLKRDGRGRKRNYKKEYKRDHKPKKDKKDRASRNVAHARLNPQKGSEVHHKDGNPQHNSPGNIATVSRSYNRADGNRRRRKA